jgi:hypothetical protein
MPKFYHSGAVSRPRQFARRPCGFDREAAPNPPIFALGSLRGAPSRGLIRGRGGDGRLRTPAQPRHALEANREVALLCLDAPVDSPGSWPRSSGPGQPYGQQPGESLVRRSSFTWNSDGSGICRPRAPEIPPEAGAAAAERCSMRIPMGRRTVCPCRTPAEAFRGTGAAGVCVSRGTIAGALTPHRRHGPSPESTRHEPRPARWLIQQEGPELGRSRLVGAYWHHASSRLAPLESQLKCRLRALTPRLAKSPRGGPRPMRRRGRRGPVGKGPRLSGTRLPPYTPPASWSYSPLGMRHSNPL